MTGPETLSLDFIQAREGEALARLAAATGGLSLCVLTPEGGPMPAAKYHEGAAAALAEVRRAIRRLPSLSVVSSGLDTAGHSPSFLPPAENDAARQVAQRIRAQWYAQSLLPARSGRIWARYFAGGLDALAQLLDEAPV